MVKLTCPKCGSKHSWLEKDGEDVIQRCMCGLTKYLLRDQDASDGVRSPDVTLPAEGTKIHKCLMAVRDSYPKDIMTGDIANRTGLKGKETASLVVTLMGRGLLERVAARRGLHGGSIWKLTITATELLELEKGVDDYGTSTGYAGGTQFLSEQHRGNGGSNPHADSGDVGDRWFGDQEGDDWP